MSVQVHKVLYELKFSALNALSVSSGVIVLRHFVTRALEYLGLLGTWTLRTLDTLVFRFLTHLGHKRGINFEDFLYHNN